MAHFAKVENGIVTQVIVAEKDIIDSGILGDPSLWIQTSYNTRNGIYYEPNTNFPSQDQSKALRGNFAGVGHIYDIKNDVFYEPQPFPSWVLNTNTWAWYCPMPYPNDGHHYKWNEFIVNWEKIE